jgi:hypothetical protein
MFSTPTKSAIVGSAGIAKTVAAVSSCRMRPAMMIPT